MAPPESSRPPTPAQRRVLDVLRRIGPCTTAELATALGTTDVAARQHTAGLEEAGLVAQGRAAADGRGRPPSVWSVTEAARPHFPDTHAELTIGLLSATREALGPDGLARVLDARAEAQIADYRERMPPPSASLRRRVEALAVIRTDEGYMAEARADGRGTWLLIEHHCPVCAAATVCQGLCAAEARVFREVLGPEVEVERTEHLLAGGARCVYRVRRR